MERDVRTREHESWLSGSSCIHSTTSVSWDRTIPLLTNLQGVTSKVRGRRATFQFQKKTNQRFQPGGSLWPLCQKWLKTNKLLVKRRKKNPGGVLGEALKTVGENTHKQWYGQDADSLRQPFDPEQWLTRANCRPKLTSKPTMILSQKNFVRPAFQCPPLKRSRRRQRCHQTTSLAGGFLKPEGPNCWRPTPQQLQHSNQHSHLFILTIASRGAD